MKPFFVNSGTRGRVWIRFFWVYLAGAGEPKSEPAGEAALLRDTEVMGPVREPAWYLALEPPVE